ncbi:hypothetical protein GGR58DRAFT_458297 [Xylaria digitata]|nr:hypothetical protein GGR58DRAFT_458297 [Xylaria digitata]
MYPPWILLLRRWRKLIMGKQAPDNDEEAGLPGFNLSSSSRAGRYSWTITHSYFANMGGFVIDPDAETGEAENSRHISDHEFARLSEKLKAPCQYDEDTIKDKSKSDAFAKGLAVIQNLQLVLSLIVRKIRGLPTSQLEIVTLVFAVCGVATFISCWYKPGNVTVPLPLGIRSPLESTRVHGNDTSYLGYSPREEERPHRK